MHPGIAAVSVDTIMQESEKFQAHYAREKGGKPLPWHHAEPNRFLDPITETRDKPGTALDLGCGSGVDSVHLAEPVTPPADMIEGLGGEPVAVSLARNGHNHIVELASEKAVRALKPDFERFRRLETGVIATAPSDDPRYDFVSRYFASAFGIDEDPVTGSAHCALGPYWQARLGKDELLAHQVSKRGGVVRIRLAGDRAYLGGQAVTILRGELAEQALRQSRPAVAN